MAAVCNTLDHVSSSNTTARQKNVGLFCISQTVMFWTVNCACVGVLLWWSLGLALETIREALLDLVQWGPIRQGPGSLVYTPSQGNRSTNVWADHRKTMHAGILGRRRLYSHLSFADKVSQVIAYTFSTHSWEEKSPKTDTHSSWKTPDNAPSFHVQLHPAESYSVSILILCTEKKKKLKTGFIKDRRGTSLEK